MTVDVLLWDRDADWRALRTATADARDVPSALDRLANAASDDEAREAYWDLDNVVVVQGTVYEAAVPTMSPILRMLLVGAPPSRRWGIELVLQVVGGWTDADEQRRTGRDLVAEARELVARSMDLFLGLLASPERHVREFAFEIVVSLGDSAERIGAALRWVMEHTVDPDEKAYYLGLLDGRDHD